MRKHWMKKQINQVNKSKAEGKKCNVELLWSALKHETWTALKYASTKHESSLIVLYLKNIYWIIFSKQFIRNMQYDNLFYFLVYFYDNEVKQLKQHQTFTPL